MRNAVKTIAKSKRHVALQKRGTYFSGLGIAVPTVAVEVTPALESA
jgi:hypothetical protein